MGNLPSFIVRSLRAPRRAWPATEPLLPFRLFSFCHFGFSPFVISAFLLLSFRPTRRNPGAQATDQRAAFRCTILREQAVLLSHSRCADSVITTGQYSQISRLRSKWQGRGAFKRPALAAAVRSIYSLPKSTLLPGSMLYVLPRISIYTGIYEGLNAISPSSENTSERYAFT